MDDIKVIAKQAKKRLATDSWRQCKHDLDEAALTAERNGKNANKVKSHLYGKVKSAIRGEEHDEFYLKVKRLLDEFGETSDALGRLTDGDYYATLSYEDRQRYTMELSSKYLAALEKYRREKEGGV